MPSREERARRLGVPVDHLPDGRGKHGKHARGAAHPRWNSGIAQSSHGYLRVRVGVEPPLADPNGYAYLHQLVWFSAQATRGDRDVLVHHADEDKHNNRLSNLEEQSRSAHGEMHIARRSRDERGRVLPEGAA